jgi:hypothetical protein
MGKHDAVWRRGYQSQRPAQGAVVAQPKKGSRLIRFVQRYPLVLVFMAWLVFLLIAGLAVVNITSLDASRSQAPSQASPVVQSPAPLSPPQTEPALLPMRSLIAVGLSCAIGCLIMLQCLKPRRSAKRPQQTVFSAPSARAAHPRKIAPHKAAASAAEHKISIVSSELSHPLDWDGPSLADSLDIRQKKPLSHWL